MMKMDVDKFYYVDGMQASSLPNAVVVSQKEAEFGEKPDLNARSTDRFGLLGLKKNNPDVQKKE